MSSATTEPPARGPLPEAQRRKMIAQRQETSVFWATVHLLGSLKFAVLLLLIISTSVAIATFVESDFDTPIAHYYIYDAWWFTLWLIALVVNLAAAALTRWPWQNKHTGFVITHAGIILLLVGGLVGKFAGFEAFVTLTKGEEPTNILTTRETVLNLSVSGDRGIYETPLPVEVLPPSPERPHNLTLPGPTKLRLYIDGFSETLRPTEHVIASADPHAPAGVQLRFESLMMGQKIDAPLMIGNGPDGIPRGHFDFFTLAEVDFLPELPDENAVPEPTSKLVTFQEGHVVLARHPESPIINSSLENGSGYRFALLPNNEGQPGEVVVRLPDGSEQHVPFEEARAGEQALPGGMVTFHVREYWPDFAVRDGLPDTISDEPNNPAMLVQVRGMFDPNPAPAPKPHLYLAPAQDGSLAYRLQRDGATYDEGTLRAGDRLPLGWADWSATVVAYEPHAGMRREVMEAVAPVNPTVGGPQAPMGVPGIRARLVAPDGSASEPQWIMAGMGTNLFYGEEFVQLRFLRNTITIPFTVELENFEVPRDEGTDTPADFISSLRFLGPEGEVVQDEAHMNSPAMFPGGLWRSALGWNYKFSQAHWDPENLDETSLQILYDPGWPLKWVGSLLICVGIAIMFYFKPYGKKKRPEASPAS